MKYENTVAGKFITRKNRFIAEVEIDGRTETVHVKNTGRCLELLVPGAAVSLEIPNSEKSKGRKTGYDLVAVEKAGLGWVNIDSQIPNKLVKEWLESKPDIFPNLTVIRPEYKYGNSRVDFYIEEGDEKILLEVKGCTLEENGIGYFPDAPTERGVKHLYELKNAAEQGYRCYVAFVIALPNVDLVLPNYRTHPEFGFALNEAVEAGVRVIYIRTDVTADSLGVRNAALI